MPSPSTTAFLSAAESTSDADYAAVRQWVRDGLPLLAALGGGAKTLQSDLYNATEDETDDAFASQFHETSDKLRSIDRLSTEISAACRQLAQHLRNTDEHTAELRALATTTATTSVSIDAVAK